VRGELRKFDSGSVLQGPLYLDQDERLEPCGILKNIVTAFGHGSDARRRRLYLYEHRVHTSTKAVYLLWMKQAYLG
jgi:hypothetical protein